MTTKHERILSIYFLLAGIVFLLLFQPVNGYDSPPEKVVAGDTLYEYVSEKFGGNQFLTRTAFENFPEPYALVVYCHNDPIDNCDQRVPLIPDKDILFANTSESSSDGDSIEVKGNEILITKPSGAVEKLPFVTNDQLEVKKYTQLVQNIVLAGSLIMAGILLLALLSDRKMLVTGKQPAVEKELNRWVQTIINQKILIYSTWSIIVIFITLPWALTSNVLGTLMALGYAHIPFVLMPVLFLTSFFLMPFYAIAKQPSTTVVLILSIAVGMFSVAGFYIMEVIITNGRF